MNFNTAAFERFAVTIQKNDIIFCEYEPGDAFYLIQEGRVRISKIMGDIEKTIDVLYPGEIFGEMAILEEAPRSASAIALDRVKALEFNRENFAILLQGNPQIAMKLLKLFTKRIYDQRRRFQILTIEDPQARIADVFLMLSEQLPPDQINDRNQAIFDITIDDVAHWAGLSINKTREIINQLVTQNKIEVMSGRITVRNIHDLKRFVQSRRSARQ